MGKINGCLKCIFIFFNVLFAILGCLMIYGAVKSTVVSNQLSAIGGPSLGWSWVFAIGVLGISCLGIYAGCSEKPLALKIFAGFMGIGMIIMLIFGIIVLVTRNKIRDGLQDVANEITKNVMEDKEMREMLDNLQQTSQCCGLVSADDWGNDIPNSCECRSSYGCKSKPQGARGPDQIYQQTCGEFIYALFGLIFNFAIGLCFAFAVTALLGLLISLLMIHQVKRDDSTGASISMKGY